MSIILFFSSATVDYAFAARDFFGVVNYAIADFLQVAYAVVI